MNRTPPNTRRARAALLALACLLTVFHGAGVGARRGGDGGGAHSGAAATTATREGRLRVFDEVWEQVRARYYDPGLGGVDWQGARARFRPQAAEARGAAEFYAVTRRMLALLRDPHTRVYAPGESADWRERRYVSVGVSVREVGGELLVSSVERDSEAERAGLRRGDALLGVDGVEARARVTRLLAEQGSDGAAGASRAARVIALARLFEGESGTFASVTFRDRRGRARDARLRREPLTRTPRLQVRREDGGRAGVVRFNVFTPEIAAELVRALRTELKGARGLVVDLRDNGGGESEAMTDIASVFLPAGSRLGRFLDREGRIQIEPHARTVMFSGADSITKFGGPVVLLTDARTASASEVFAAALREAGRAAAILGEHTCGCVLGIRRRHALPDGGMLDISELDYLTARGQRLEGVGLRPDEAIAPDAADLRTGRDRALERALQIIKQSTGKK